MTEADVAGYTPVIRQPVEAGYRGYRIVSTPPPSSGGVTVLQILKLLERFPIGSSHHDFEFGATRTLHVMLEAMRLRGGYISTRRSIDGSDTPYELNISYFDAFRPTQNDPGGSHVAAFLLSQTIALSFKGIPAVYIHSLLASPNDTMGVERTGLTRAVNRRQWDRGELEGLMANHQSETGRVFQFPTLRQQRLVKQDTGQVIELLLFFSRFELLYNRVLEIDLQDRCRSADILVAAVGRPGMVTGDWVKPGATVIDVGINRTDDGLVGDVDFASVEPIAGAITPVPGGVGPMTIAMLMANTVMAAEASARL